MRLSGRKAWDARALHQLSMIMPKNDWTRVIIQVRRGEEKRPGRAGESGEDVNIM